ncbi:MAG: zinc-dependent alcohol dehydrogenase family protein [Burkholderiales bacterium]|nr:zinc-dependent alcohol dehydrogenase family protein [Burkholderiales bacterium]
MKRIELAECGAPEEVARCVERPDVGVPAADEVKFEVLAFPINPSDLMFCTGDHGVKPALPACPGTECVGRVIAVGRQIAHVAPGDLVINLQRENWAQQRRVKGDDVIRLPHGIDLRQAAMLKVNPATALLMLDLVDLRPGDWVMQNAANSAVGRLLISLARARGLRTINIVRREAVVDELKRLGADVCLVDGPSLARRVGEAAGGAPVRLAIDAIGGREARRLGFAVSEDGTVCNYGTLSGPDVVAASSDLIVRGVRYVGFWLARSLRTRSLDEIRSMYAQLAGLVLAGELHAPVEAVYPIEEIGSAIRHAQRGGRNGKILVANGGITDRGLQ